MGGLFVARAASIIATCRLQNKKVRKYLNIVTERYFAKKTPPLFSEI